MITQWCSMKARVIILCMAGFSGGIMSYSKPTREWYRDTYICKKTLLWSPLQMRSTSMGFGEFITVQVTGSLLDGSRCCKCKINTDIIGLYYEEPDKGYVLRLVRILAKQLWYQRQYNHMMRGMAGLLLLGGAAFSAYCASLFYHSSAKRSDIYASGSAAVGVLLGLGGLTALYHAYRSYFQVKEVYAPYALAELVGRGADQYVMISNPALDEILSCYMNKEAQPYCLSCLKYDKERHDHSIAAVKYFWGEPSLAKRRGESRFLVLNLGNRSLKDHNKSLPADFIVALH